MYYCDIAVIGGGASALAAAIEAARGGAFVYILERLGRVGKKLLVTGNGRCNLSNIGAACDSFTGSEALIAPILERFGNAVGFFASMGLYTRTDSAGRIYPMNNAASAVLDALRLECARLGAAELCDFEAVSIEDDGPFTVTASDGRKVKAGKVIFACGGKAAPKLGTDGSAFSMLRRRGISVTPLSPALSPLQCSSPELRALKGQRVSAAVHAYRENTPVAKTEGEVQFGDGTLSGICVFDTAAFFPDELALDLLPEYSKEEVFNMLRSAASCRSDAAVEEAFTGLFPKRVAQCLLRRVTKLPLNTPCGDFSLDELRSLAAVAKDWRFAVGSGNWEKAQVTCGGVPYDELSGTLELKKLPGVYVCGEAVDTLGPCGGYNLHWAWASGRQAGRSALETLR